MNYKIVTVQGKYSPLLIIHQNFFYCRIFDILNHMIHDQTKHFSWDGSTHEHLEKTTDWYWGLGIVIVTGIAIAIISKNYLLAILLAMGGVMLGIYANDRPSPIHVEMSEHGIKLNKDLYLYETIESFWMYRDHRNRDQLLIITGSKILPQRIVSLPSDVSTTEIRTFLLDYIPEKETKPVALDILASSIGL